MHEIIVRRIRHSRKHRRRLRRCFEARADVVEIMWVLWGSLGRICLAYGESSTVKNDTKVNKIPQKATKVRAEMELTWFDIYIVTGVLLNYLCQ